MKGYNQFTFEERTQIEKLLSEGYNVPLIAQILGRSKSGIYHEIQRNTNTNKYDAVTAHEKASARAKNIGKKKIISEGADVLNYISKQILIERKSVRTIADDLPDSNFPRLCVNTIYNYINSGMIPGVSMDSLKNDTTKMYSNGLLRIPSWVRDKTDFADGDIFEISIVDSDTVIFKRIKTQNTENSSKS